ncbi:FecR family protein [Sphingobacterium psychroaquaticum]|uniref:FecR family protein n=1 Tax=Sphingobacterium psychroaquaticum TaxID=561061 RepID=UPI001F0E614D|nr:FecR domain-containing protein [Sphingobacterium psychroaquaticum]
MEELDLSALLSDESFINYCTGRNAEDIAKWEHWLFEHPQFRDAVEEQKKIGLAMAAFTAEHNVEQNYLRLKERMEPSSMGDKRPFRLGIWGKVAASLFLVAAGSVVAYRFKDNLLPESVAHGEIAVVPGGNEALLTLDDGTVISLADANRGTIAEQAGIRIEKDKDGNLIYHADGGAAPSRTAYNTISTPDGGQYTVVLPDGSKAFLNAASSLRYPVQFATNQRRVTMTGEVYFEIEKQNQHTDNGAASVPFYVDTDKQQIEVLGTHFNVNAYSNEPSVVTTLVEGSVRVKAMDNGQTVLLRPGQQAVLTHTLQVRPADMEQQLAWKNGDFVFHGEELHSILRKVERWYDIDVDCPVQLGQLRFEGIVSRKQPLSAIIDMVQATGKVKIQLKERRMTVTE